MTWRTTFYGRWPLIEDDPWWKTAFVGKRPMFVETLLDLNFLLNPNHLLDPKSFFRSKIVLDPIYFFLVSLSTPTAAFHRKIFGTQNFLQTKLFFQSSWKLLTWVLFNNTWEAKNTKFNFVELGVLLNR